jgi:hypothetical protein
VDDEQTYEEPALIRGQWYQFAVPGGFLMFGRFVKELGLGAVRFADVRHLRHAGQVELPAMCKTGFGAETKITTAKWRHWNGTPLWWAPIDNPNRLLVG